MGSTVIEKIFFNHLIDGANEVKPGEIHWISLDYRTARDFGGANVVNNLETNFTGDIIDDREKTMFTFDCVVPAKTIPYAINQHRCRKFAREHNVRVHDVDAGIGTHILLDHYGKPGMTAVGTDSHFNIMGAVSCFGQGMGDIDIAYVFRTGKTWFEIPESVRVDFIGTRRKNISAKDIVLYLLQIFGSRTFLGKSVELYGPAVEELTLDERITIASMGTEMGAISIMIPPRGLEDMFSPDEMIAADPDAEYAEKHTVDLDNLTTPLVSVPPYPHTTKPVTELADTAVDTVFVGSCTNGRYSDIKAVADIVAGKHIRTNGYIVPSTNDIYRRLLKDGTIETLSDAGFLISNPGCGGCASGQIGMTGEDEVTLFTSNRNFKGKQGSGRVYLGSPQTAAFTALEGSFRGAE